MEGRVKALSQVPLRILSASLTLHLTALFFFSVHAVNTTWRVFHDPGYILDSGSVVHKSKLSVPCSYTAVKEATNEQVDLKHIL